MHPNIMIERTVDITQSKPYLIRFKLVHTDPQFTNYLKGFTDKHRTVLLAEKSMFGQYSMKAQIVSGHGLSYMNKQVHFPLSLSSYNDIWVETVEQQNDLHTVVDKVLGRFMDEQFKEYQFSLKRAARRA